MSDRLEPFDVECDSPPYVIVRACQRLGFRDPEDVRWCRLSHFLAETHADWRGMLLQPWKLFASMRKLGHRTCYCGRELPRLEECKFTLTSGTERAYHIGQCARCRAIFWDEAQ